MNIPESLKRKATQISFRFPQEHREACLVPLMFEVQRELGYIPPEAEEWVAETLGVSLVKVREVRTFYAMIRATKPGKYLIMFCRNICCCLAGGEELQEYVESALGIKPGETTEDGLFTLQTWECLGGCAWAPMMLVNENQYFQLTREKIDRILQGCRRGEIVPPDHPTALLGNVGGTTKR